MLGNIAGEVSGIFDRPDDPEGAQQLHGIYVSIQRAILIAVKSGELAIRAWPLWNKVPVGYMDEYDKDDIPRADFGIAISDLHEWLQPTGYPVAKTPAALYEVFKRRWADIVDEPPPDSVTVTPNDGQSFQVVGFSGVPHGKKGQWYKDNADTAIHRSLDTLGEGATRTAILTWACENNKGTSYETWKRNISAADITRVKNENREK